MTIKKGDFIEIEYTGKVKEGNIIFDTTNEEIAKQNNIYNENYRYGPITICIGESQVLKGLDKQLEGKDLGAYTFDITADDAFGKKSAKLLRMVPTSVFKKQNITPFPGLQINMDGIIGTIKTVAGGRIIVDFNHPLASKDIVYEIKINKVVMDDKEKIKSYLELQLNQKNIRVEITNNKAKVLLANPVPKEYIDLFSSKLKELTNKDIEFIESGPETAKEENKDKPEIQTTENSSIVNQQSK